MFKRNNFMNDTQARILALREQLNTYNEQYYVADAPTVPDADAEILETAADVFAKAEMIIKVKEPQAVERAMLREDQILFTYLHLAPDLPQTEDLVKSN